MIYNQIVTWTAFAILAMFTNWSRPLCIIYWSECIIFEPLELKVDDKVFDKLFACLKKKKVIKKTLKYPKHENGYSPMGHLEHTAQRTKVDERGFSFTYHA